MYVPYRDSSLESAATIVPSNRLNSPSGIGYQLSLVLSLPRWLPAIITLKMCFINTFSFLLSLAMIQSPHEQAVCVCWAFAIVDIRLCPYRESFNSQKVCWCLCVRLWCFFVFSHYSVCFLYSVLTSISLDFINPVHTSTIFRKFLCANWKLYDLCILY